MVSQLLLLIGFILVVVGVVGFFIHTVPAIPLIVLGVVLILVGALIGGRLRL